MLAFLPILRKKVCYPDGIMPTSERMDSLGTHLKDIRVCVKEQAWEMSLQRVQRPGVAGVFVGIL